MSRRQAHRLALHYAIAERDSYADAWHFGSEERARAERQSSEFRRVLHEEFGEITSEDALAQSNMVPVSINDLPLSHPKERDHD